MKKITLLLCLMLSFAISAQTTIWEDDFESYTDFEITTIGDYTQVDNDGGTTWGSTTYDFENEGYVGTGIIWNPSAATPDATGSDFDVAGGSKGLYFFASGANGTTTPNDDWFVTPQVNLTDYTGAMFTFTAKSLTDQFGLERIEVAVSTTGTAPGDFTVISPGGAFEEVPITYTDYSYDLSAYDGEQIYLAIHYVTNDAFVLQMDNFKVEGTSLSTEEFSLNSINHYFNFETKVLTLNSQVALKDVVLYNVLGQETYRNSINSNVSEQNLSGLQSGIYIAKINSADNKSKTIKLVIK